MCTPVDSEEYACIVRFLVRVSVRVRISVLSKFRGVINDNPGSRLKESS